MLNLYGVDIVTKENGIFRETVVEENAKEARREALRLYHLCVAESENSKVIGTISYVISYDI